MIDARLILEDGKIFRGQTFSQGQDCFGELIFNTAMCGYEEVLTDPSYKEQIVLFTYPLIGSYGINLEDSQSDKIQLQAVVVKEYIDFPSNWRSKQTLKSYLESQNILGVEGIDTRTLTRNLRDTGAKKALLTTSTESDEVLIQKVKNSNSIIGQNLAKKVSTSKPYIVKELQNPSYKVAVLDCGVKTSILDSLVNKNCEVTVLPYDTPADTILSQSFDGILISNGPGDPEAVPEAMQTVQQLLGKIPLFGICLGHQILTLAIGAKITKLRFGHHGSNHPIKNLATNKIEITAQNHIYNTQDGSLPEDFEASHINLNDQTIAGIRSHKLMAFSVQYHPEANPGPSDSHYLFDDFIHLMKHKVFKSIKKESYAQTI